MKKLIFAFIALSTTFFYLALPSQVQAEIYIEIDKFTPERKFPIAIAKFVNAKGDQSQKLTQILKKNLKLAGYFEIIKQSSFSGQNQSQSQAYKEDQINFSKWTSLGANALITGFVKSSGSKSTIELRLFDPQLKKLLVGKRYKVKNKNIHVAIHRFMDEILLALTGEKGFYNSKIVAACGKGQNKRIYTMNVDGSDFQILNKKMNALSLSPTWSPLADSVAFTSYANGFPEIYINQLGKKKARKLTFNKALNITPTFSPDGKTLIISSSMGGDPDLYLFDLQGNQLKKLTQSDGIDIAPSFSPDGERIIFASERLGNLHLYVMNKAGGLTSRLTYFGYQNDSPDWSPRGDRIVYSSRISGNFDIATMNADGSGYRSLTFGGASDESPSFSPDGRYIAYNSVSRGGRSQLMMMMWDGYNKTVIDSKHNCMNPEWSNWLDAKNSK